MDSIDSLPFQFFVNGTPFDFRSEGTNEFGSLYSLSGAFGTIHLTLNQHVSHLYWSCAYQIKEAIKLTIKRRQRCLSFHYVLRNSFEVHSKTHILPLAQHQYVAAYVPEFAFDMMLKPGQYETFALYFHEDDLKSWLSEFPRIVDFLEKLPSDQLELLNAPTLIHRQVLGLILNIQNCSYRGGIREKFIDIKLQELIFLSIKHLFITPDVNASDYYDQLIKVRDHIIQNLFEPLGISQLSRIAGMNRHTLRTRFKEVFGKTIYRFIVAERMDYAWKMLVDSDLPINELSLELGYSNLPAFTNAFKRHFGYPPSHLRKGLLD